MNYDTTDPIWQASKLNQAATWGIDFQTMMESNTWTKPTSFPYSLRRAKNTCVQHATWSTNGGYRGNNHTVPYKTRIRIETTWLKWWVFADQYFQSVLNAPLITETQSKTVASHNIEHSILITTVSVSHGG